MMNKFSAILLILSLSSLPVSFAQSSEYERCAIDVNQLSLLSWEKCNGKVVKVKGKIADFVMRHPVGLHDMLDINTFERNKRYQTYVDIGGYQIVLSSGERIHCNKCIDIEGIVDIVDLEGGEGTKGSYKNAWIKVLNFSCAECD